MKKMVSVAIIIIFVGMVATEIKHKVKTATFEKKVENTEKEIWALAAVAVAMQTDIQELCRTDIYLPHEPPAEAIRGCEKARDDLKLFKITADKAIANFNQLNPIVFTP